GTPTKGEFTPRPVHVHDLQATILHLLGIDHTRLTYFFQGRRFRLTDVHGHVVHDLLTCAGPPIGSARGALSVRPGTSRVRRPAAGGTAVGPPRSAPGAPRTRI